MSQIFDGNNKAVPVTLIEAGPCFVAALRTLDKDGYEAVQIAMEEAPAKAVKKPQQGHFKKSGLASYFRYLKEFRGKHSLKEGDKIDVSLFLPGEKVKVSAFSKAKGFQGVVKRHGFSGAPATHGTKHNERAPGSIGSAFPERVFKGKKMAGRMGGERLTISGLKVAAVDQENNLLALKGAVPGRKGTLVEVVVTKELAQNKEAEQKQDLPQEKEAKDKE